MAYTRTLVLSDSMSNVTSSADWIPQNGFNAQQGPRSAQQIEQVTEGGVTFTRLWTRPLPAAQTILGVSYPAGTYASALLNHSKTAGHRQYGVWEWWGRYGFGPGQTSTVNTRSVALLWPDSGWPPEIDMVEMGGAKTNLDAFEVNIHWTTPTVNDKVSKTTLPLDLKVWRKYEFVWREDFMSLAVDGTVLWTMTEVAEGRIPDEVMSFKAQTAIETPTAPTTCTPRSMDLRDLKVYSETFVPGPQSWRPTDSGIKSAITALPRSTANPLLAVAVTPPVVVVPPAPVPVKARYKRVTLGGVSQWVRRGRDPILVPSDTPVTSTASVFPNLETHPNARWTLSADGKSLTSEGRRPYPVFTNTDTFVLGTTEPTWANSGCRIPKEQLTVNNTVNLITTADGQVIEGLWLPNGRIEVRHRNVTIRDCLTNVGRPGDKPLIHDNNGITMHPSFDTSGCRIEYVTVDPNYPATLDASGNVTSAAFDDDPRLNGMYVAGGTSIYRCAVRGVTDGIAPDVNANFAGTLLPVHIWGCYLETRFLDHDTLNPDGTHNDCIQWAGGDGTSAIGNAQHNPATTTASGIKGQCNVMTPYHQPTIRNPVIYRNWMYGSYTQVSSWAPWWQGGPATVGLFVVGNRHMGQTVWPILCTPASQITARKITGNVVGSAGIDWNNGHLNPGAAITVNVAQNKQGTGL